jgi:hypothetical protein
MLKLLLNEGGVAGHMNHLYDNGDLTFAKLKEIFTAAAYGKLIGTEKTDGQNLMLSFSAKDRRAKGARNQDDIKNGGLKPEELARKFAKRKNPALKKTFSDALKIFEKAIQSLGQETIIDLFGQDTNIYYNADVMDPRAPNVIQYDTKNLIIHRAGHGEYDRTTGSKTAKNVSDKAAKLEKIILAAQEKIKHQNYGLQVNAIKKLEALSDKTLLKKYFADIDKILQEANKNKNISLSDSSTINEYMMARVMFYIDETFATADEKIKAISPIVKMNIAKKILGISELNVLKIKKELTPEQKNFVEERLLNKEAISNILKNSIAPLEDTVSEFATEMLKTMKSIYILDDSKEVKRLQNEVQKAIEAIESSGNEEAISILKRQLQKLKSADMVTVAVEGFVFDYDKVTYKLTGNFAPVNQLLGLFKYGRGKKIPPMQKEKTIQEADNTIGKADIALVPGAFKPPHRGHLDMIKQYVDKANAVIVFVSAIQRHLPTGEEVTFQVSKKIWDMYLKAEGLQKSVTIVKSPHLSPVQSCLEFISNKEKKADYAQPGQKIILGVSTKGGDEARFQNKAQKYARDGVEVEVIPVEPTGDISASNMRHAISENNFKEISEYLPNSIKNKMAVAREIVKMIKSENSLKENIIYDIINGMLNERIAKKGDKYCLLSKKRNKNLGCYNSRKGAKKRERQVQYFKHLKEMSVVADVAGYAVKDIDKKEEK